MQRISPNYITVKCSKCGRLCEVISSELDCEPIICDECLIMSGPKSELFDETSRIKYQKKLREERRLGMEISENEKVRRGQMIVDTLGLKRKGKNPGLYETKWGHKTTLGIYESISRIIIDGE